MPFSGINQREHPIVIDFVQPIVCSSGHGGSGTDDDLHVFEDVLKAAVICEITIDNVDASRKKLLRFGVGTAMPDQRRSSCPLLCKIVGDNSTNKTRRTDHHHRHLGNLHDRVEQ